MTGSSGPAAQGEAQEPSRSRCLDVRGELTHTDRQRRRVFDLLVPARVVKLKIEFRYQPGEVDGVHNLLTLSLFDPRGFRGAAHRWNQHQIVTVATNHASPGFLAGPILPGHWRLELDAHEVVNDGQDTGSCSFSLIAETTEDGLEEALPSDPVASEVASGAGPRTGARWYRGDLHSHSVHCDGTDTVADMARAAHDIGLDFVGATGHNTISQWHNVEALPPGLQLIRGIECTTYHGHANVLGATDWIDWRVESAATGARQILDQSRDQGAFAVVNHPFAEGNPVCTGCRWDYPADDLPAFDAIEIWNGGWRSPEVDNAAALALWTSLLIDGHRIAAVAGSDAHSAADYRRKELPYTWVYASALGGEEILAALRAGRAYLTRGPTLSFVGKDEAGRRATLPGDELRAGRVDLEVAVAGLASSADLRLVSDGAALQIGRFTSRRGKVTARAAAERWWRLELRSADSAAELIAITNPVFHVTV